MEKCHFLMILISKNGPDMASVHKFWYFLLVTYSFLLKNYNFWTKLDIHTRLLQKNEKNSLEHFIFRIDAIDNFRAEKSKLKINFSKRIKVLCSSF